jgi:aminoglycoside 6-adenylyltransferase
VDRFSDYDVLCIVDDIRPFHADSKWLSEIGEVLVVFRNPIGNELGFDCFGFITHYQDGTKIDFGFYPIAFLKWARQQERLPDELDRGYVVLLDKDRLSEGLPAPSYSAYCPRPPTQEEYRLVVEEFFNDAAYVAKSLWRDNLFAAKLSLDHIMKYQCLRRMLEWEAQMRHGWSARIGSHAKRLKPHADPGFWSRLENTYVGSGHAENWDALFNTVALFRDVATVVAQGLGLEYLKETDDQMVEYLRGVRQLK